MPKKPIQITPAVMTLHWFLRIIWLVPVSLTGAVPLEITDWSSTGGTTRNKTDQKDEMYLVEPGNKIILKVEAENVRNYEWQVEDQSFTMYRWQHFNPLKWDLVIVVVVVQWLMEITP